MTTRWLVASGYVQWRREGLWRPWQTFVLPPLLARGPSRLEVREAPQRACVLGGASAEDEYGAF